MYKHTYKYTCVYMCDTCILAKDSFLPPLHRRVAAKKTKSNLQRRQCNRKSGKEIPLKLFQKCRNRPKTSVGQLTLNPTTGVLVH